MTAPKTRHESAERSILFINSVPVQKCLLRRAASIAAALDSPLDVFCPVVVPPAPHTSVSGRTPAWREELRLAREQGRRTAGMVQAILNEEPIESHVEAGVCHSMTEAIRNASDRLHPELVLFPSPDQHALINEPFHARFQDLLPAIDAPIWTLKSGDSGGSNICALVFLESVSEKNAADANRVVGEAARLAKRFGSEVHLIAFTGAVPALEAAKGALAPSSRSIAQHREDRLIRRLYELGESYAVSAPHVQLFRGVAGEDLARLLDPFQIGLVVTSARRRRWLGRFLKRDRAPDLFDLPCDLMILGEADETHA